MITEISGKKPKIHEQAWVAETAQVIGDVTIDSGSSVWPGAVLRGDLAPIKIGKNCSIQDNAVLHNDPGLPTIIQDNVTIAHLVAIHSAKVESNCIIGIGAILLNGSKVGENSIIAAGAVVREGQEIPSKSLAAGVPAKVLKSLDQEAIQRIKTNAEHYVQLAKQYSL